MRALILCAGRGERMRPLTDSTPKPLLSVGGKRLVEWHIEKLARIGVQEIVINTSHLAEQFPEALGDGTRYGVTIAYSYEGPTALETGGGMQRALPLLGDAPFIAVNGDIWTNFEFGKLPQEPAGLAHVVLVDNPEHHARGDFILEADAQVRDRDDVAPALTFAGIGVYRPELVANGPGGAYPLGPVLRKAMGDRRVTGQHHAGAWTDVGTPERLAEIVEALATFRVWEWGVEFDWFAIDADGNVGHFSTAGFGCVPLGILDRRDDAYELAELMLQLPVLGDAEGHAPGRIDDWLEMARRGFHSFDWDHRRYYRRAATPSVPLHISAIPPELLGTRPIVSFPRIRFPELMTFDPRSELSCE